MPASDEYYRKRGKEYKPNIVHGYGGIDAFNALQDRRTTAFPSGRSQDRDGTSAQEIAEEARSSGMKINPDGTMSPARTPSQVTYNPVQARREQAAQSRRQGSPLTPSSAASAEDMIKGVVDNATAEVKAGGNPDLVANKAIEEANTIAAAGWGAPVAMGGGAGSGNMDNGLGGGGVEPVRPGRRARDQPGYRGGFSKPQQQIQRPGIGSPTMTPPRSLPTPDEVASRAREMADERSMQRDMANNTTRTNDVFGNPSEIRSKYGTGKIDYLTSDQNKSRPLGTVMDDFGRQVPIRDEVDRLGYNQGTKGMAALPGQPSGNFGGIGGIDPSRLRQMARGGAGRV